VHLKPFKTLCKTSNSLYTFVEDGEKFLVKCYCKPAPEPKRTRESFMLDHWIELGFNVPKIVTKKIECIKAPYLVTSFIEGPSLREYLLGNSYPLEEKFELLTRFFQEMAYRHKISINSNDPDIAHHDPSTDNVILAENRFYFIDFETPRKKRSVIELASIEIATICRWIVRDLGIDYVQEVLKRMVAVYKGQDNLLKPIVKRTSGRPFQFYHRWQDERKKVANPKDVTKYDIADGLAELSTDSGLR